MNPEPDSTRIVRSWLEDGATGLSDRVLDNVLNQLPSTPQRRHWWQARRSPRMINGFKLALAAAAVVVAAVIGINLFSDRTVSGVGAAPSSEAPAASATQGPVATSGAVSTAVGAVSTAVGSGPLAGGRYHIDRQLDVHDGSKDPGAVARVTFDVPEGWSGFDGLAITKGGAGGSSQLALAPMDIAAIYLDPCRTSGIAGRRGVADWDRGTTVDGLTDGLWASWSPAGSPSPSDRPGSSPTAPAASKPVTVTLAGLDARYVEVTAPAALDFAACDRGQYTLWVDAQGGERYVHAAGELNRLWVVDAAGSAGSSRRGLLVLDAASHPDSSPGDLAELQAIIDSVEIEFRDTP